MLLSIIVPTYNEIEHIRKCLDSLLATSLKNNEYEIIIIDGGSNDGTREVLKCYSESNLNIKVLDNPNQKQVYALNIGINNCSGEYIVRCDAHSIYPENYAVNLITYLASAPSDVLNVGTPYITTNRGGNIFSRSIKVAMSNIFGAGSSHRSINLKAPKYVDTVLFGAWRKSTFECIGLFDENFIRGQDFEHNFRIIKASAKVVMIPAVPFQYFTRNKILDFAKMIYQYAYSKPIIVKKHKTPPPFRSLVPAIFLFNLCLTPFFHLSTILTFLYFIISIIISLHSYVKKNITFVDIPLLVFTFFIGHMSHGLGTIVGYMDAFLLNKNHTQFQHTR